MPLKPICVKCQRFYHPRKTGIEFIESMPILPDARPGVSQTHLWKPYKLWSGDMWKCDGCDHLLIVGIGKKPIDEHHSDTFEGSIKARELVAPLLRINDC